MKIRTLINILVTVSLALLVLAFAGLYTSTREVARHDADAAAVQKLVADISNLRFTLTETILYRESRSQQLWGSSLARMRKDLNRHVYSLPSQNELSAKIRSRQEAVDELYARLIAVPSAAATVSIDFREKQELSARTTSALLVIIQEILDDAAEMDRLNREVMLSISQHRHVVSFVIVVLFGLIVFAFWIIIRKNVLVPIHRFQRGTELIAAGNLSHRIDIAGQNEIGVLARTFDAMTAQLQQSVTALQSEIVERETAQKLLTEYSERLAQDLAARKLAEERLLAAQAAILRSESRLRNVTNSAFIGIVECDYQGRFVGANDTFVALTGYDRRYLISAGCTWRTLIAEELHWILQQALDKLATTGKAEPFETTLLRDDGMTVPILLSLARLEGADDEWVGFILDLTERNRVERLKSEFISVVSHELRTPLTSIRGALGLLEGGMGGALPAPALKLIQVAHANSQRLGGLINNILDMDKLISGQMRLTMQAVDLIAIAYQAIEANAGYAALLKVSYAFGPHPDAAWAHGDAERLMQVFSNFLSNAAKFSAADQQVEIRVTCDCGKVRVAIEDHGSGIPYAFRSRVFDAFAQANSGNTREQGGTGLGLKITKALIEEMSGEVGFESEEGVGTTFWFALPSVSAT